MNKEPVKVESIGFDALFYRPHRRLFTEAMAEGVHFQPTTKEFERVVLSKIGVMGHVTNIQLFEYGDDARLPQSPKTWIVTGTWEETDKRMVNGALGFVSQGSMIADATETNRKGYVVHDQ